MLHNTRADQRNNQKHTIPVGIKASQQYLCILFMEIILIFIPFCINSLIFMIFLKLLGFSRYLFPPNMSRIHFLNTNKYFSEADIMTMVYISFPRISTINNYFHFFSMKLLLIKKYSYPYILFFSSGFFFNQKNILTFVLRRVVS